MTRTRRRFLGTSATLAIGLLAGCSSEEQMAGGDHNDDATTTTDPGTELTTEPTNTPTMTQTTGASTSDPEATTPPETTSETTLTPTPTPTPTPTTTARPSGQPAVAIDSSELRKREDSYRTEAFIRTTVTNEGDGTSGELSVTGRFYDTDGNLLDSTTVYLPYLAPGETWEAHVPYFEDGADVKSHKIDGEYDRDPPRLQVDGLTVVDTNYETSDYGASLSGVIQNELDEDADYLAAIARFWRGDVVIASGLDNETDVPAGENWAFEANYGGYGDRSDEVTDYDVVPELSIY